MRGRRSLLLKQIKNEKQNNEIQIDSRKVVLIIMAFINELNFREFYEPVNGQKIQIF